MSYRGDETVRSRVLLLAGFDGLTYESHCRSRGRIVGPCRIAKHGCGQMFLLADVLRNRQAGAWAVLEDHQHAPTEDR